jgi:F0F1-type ATP synthase membrane subunit b/b'
LLREKILTETKNESEKIILEAKKQADLQMEDMEKRAKKASLDNSLALLEKVMEKMFTKDERDKILTRSIKVLKETE